MDGKDNDGGSGSRTSGWEKMNLLTRRMVRGGQNEFKSIDNLTTAQSILMTGNLLIYNIMDEMILIAKH